LGFKFYFHSSFALENDKRFFLISNSCALSKTKKWTEIDAVRKQ
jgi:hypothetical protein